MIKKPIYKNKLYKPFVSVFDFCLNNVFRDKRYLKFFAILFSFTLITFSVTLYFEIYYKDKILEGVYLSNEYVGGLGFLEIEKILTEKTSLVYPIILSVDDKRFEIHQNDIGFSYNSKKTFELLQISGKENFKIAAFSFLHNILGPVDKKPILDLNDVIYYSYLDNITVVTDIEPTYPEILMEDETITFKAGVDGKKLDTNLVKDKIIGSLENFYNQEISVRTNPIQMALTPEQETYYLNRANKLYDKTIVINIAEENIEIENESIFTFLDPWGLYNNENILKFTKEFASKHNTDAKEPVFKFENDKVTEFIPATYGIETNKKQLALDIESLLKKIELSESGEDENVLIAHYKTIEPKTKTEDVNTYGIKELVGRGVSDYTGSISSRVHNLTLASSKFNGLLVAPDEVFSFNKTLGDVSKVTGYQQAYIIQNGQTILGDGGGVCQVSTTLFRAILNAGLPVIERKSHSYRVGYYENDSPPGLDATVFDPSPDLKFKNDTGNYLLIQASVDKTSRTLTFDFYGTKDGRVASTTKPVVTSSTPPPEDLYIDDPTLPAGTVKQIDYKAWGAKVYFDYKVERSGEVIFEKTFYSNYLPWQAKFLRGTGPL